MPGYFLLYFFRQSYSDDCRLCCRSQSLGYTARDAPEPGSSTLFQPTGSVSATSVVLLNVTKTSITAARLFFYPVPVKRLLISSVVSGGLYQIYWMYKTGRRFGAIPATTKFLRSSGGGCWESFYIYPLLQTVRLNLQRSKTEGRHFTQLAVAYTACLFIQTGLCAAFYYGSARLPYLYAVWFALTAVWLTGLYLLITLQKRINFHNRKKNTKLQLQNGWHWGEAAVIAIGFLLSFGSLFWHRPQQQNDESSGLLSPAPTE